MSLFTVHDWWSVTPGASEEFGSGCVAVGNLDNAADGQPKLATGSFAGVLRIYHPRESSFQVEDVLLEQALDAPILQLAAGKFLPDSQRTSLAVLHPRALAIYSVQAVASPSAPAGSKEASYYKKGVDSSS